MKQFISSFGRIILALWIIVFVIIYGFLYRTDPFANFIHRIIFITVCGVVIYYFSYKIQVKLISKQPPKVAPALIGACVGSWMWTQLLVSVLLYSILINRTELFTNFIRSIIFIIFFGLVIYFSYKIQVKLISKQHAEWPLKVASVLNGMCAVSWTLTMVVFLRLYLTTIYDNSCIKETPIFLIISSFSWWTYISVAYARQYATTIFRGFLIVAILLLTQYILISTYNIPLINWESIVDIIGVSAIVTTCIKGLYISFSKSWKGQFNNQTVPFMLIWVIVAIFFASIFLLTSK